MRPHIICHMLCSVDGKIDPGAVQEITRENEYETTGAELNGDAWICGRVTMQRHFAAPKPFMSATNTPAGPQPVYVARKADSYAISVDTLGKLQWPGNDVRGDHLICIVSERTAADYLAALREREISYIVSGSSAIDLGTAVELLVQHFGIRTLLLEGGGHINGAFLQAGLVDELSLLIAPGIDGRPEIPAVFDGIKTVNHTAVPLKLKSVERRASDALWLRYEVVRH